MLVYAIIFIACLIVAMIIHFAYSIISEATRSVAKTSDPIVSIRHSPRHRGNKKARRDNLDPAFQVSAWGLAKTQPAMPAHQDNWNWKGSKPTTRAQSLGYGATGVRKSSRLVYGESAKKPVVNTEWPHRKEVAELAGTAYKVTR